MTGAVGPISPPATIGMLGGGQLGKFALIAATQMGYRTIVLDPDPGAPAGVVADEHLIAAYDDRTALAEMARRCAVVTTEFENPPAAALSWLAERTRVAPSPHAVSIAQDRIAEKRFLVDNGFPVGQHQVLTDDATTAHIDVPSIIKTARLGYDGKGQRTVLDDAELLAAWAELGGVPCVVESRLALDTEVSVVVGRRGDGDVETYAVAENRHADGILDLSVVPANVSSRLADRATGLAMAIADALDYCGVLAVEMFVVDGELLVNELAPRPHNSGHWTIDASVTSQFEQQIRAVCGQALGSPEMTTPAVAMVNLLGDVWGTAPDADSAPGWTSALGDATAKLHLYGKAEPRPGRKMGHLTVRSTVASEAASRALALRDALDVRTR
ncbi:MAG: 5-(carboxyamino)imidazole ribonucleotide synthase [Actinomycetota bacterium]